MTTTTLAKRVEKLELELEALKKRVETPAATADKKKDWRRIVGVAKDDPTFDEAVRLGRQYRRRQPKC